MTPHDQGWADQSEQRQRHHLASVLSISDEALVRMKAERRTRWVWAGICLAATCALAGVIAWGCEGRSRELLIEEAAPVVTTYEGRSYLMLYQDDRGNKCTLEETADGLVCTCGEVLR